MRVKEGLLTPVRPSAGTEAWYRRQLLAIVELMHKSSAKHILTTFKAEMMAMDSIADRISNLISSLSLQFGHSLDPHAEEISTKLVHEVDTRTKRVMDKALDKAKVSPMSLGKFHLEKNLQDIAAASIRENVALIKSIPTQYYAQIERLLMDSIKHGGAMQRLVAGLEKQIQKSMDLEKKK